MKIEHPFERIVLPNGLTLLLYPMESVKSAFVVLYVRVGAVYEGKKVRGISHFVEHIGILGTKKFPTNLALSYEAETLGATFNAWTDRFSTAYWIRLPYTNLKRGIAFLRELVLDPLLDKKQLLKEKNVVISEFNDFWHNPERKYWHEIWRKRFKDKEHPYSYRPLGIPRTIKTLDEKTVKLWRQKYYCPNNMVLSIAGNFKPEMVKKLVKESFGQLKKGSPSREPKFNPQGYSKPSLYHQLDERPQITFSFSFPTFGWRQVKRREVIKLNLLSYILGGGLSSRLLQRLREKERFVYSTRSEVNFHPWMGMIQISGSSYIDKLIPALRAAKEEVEKLKKEGVSEKELNHTKIILNSNSLLRFDNPESAAYYFGGYEVDKDKIWLPEKTEKVTNGIKKEEVNRLAKKIFDFSKVNIGLLGKVPNKTKKEIEKILVGPR